MHSNHTTRDIPYGYCHCGCGQKTEISKRNRPERGHIIGEPLAFARGHNPLMPVEVRFWQKVTPAPFTDCWPWQGSTILGYGVLRFNARVVGAHRVSWELHFGHIPDGLWVLHKCDNPPCVNPYHLFLGTPADNIHDMIAKGRRGRPISPLRGEDSPNAKLKTADVIEIRKLAADSLPRYKIARQFGVTQTTVRDIVRRRTWSHVP